MSTDPRPGMIRFNGAAQAFPVTICRQCDMVLPHENTGKQIAWAVEHYESTGHKIEFAVDVRPDPATPYANARERRRARRQGLQKKDDT